MHNELVTGSEITNLFHRTLHHRTWHRKSKPKSQTSRKTPLAISTFLNILLAPGFAQHYHQFMEPILGNEQKMIQVQIA